MCCVVVNYNTHIKHRADGAPHKTFPLKCLLPSDDGRCWLKHIKVLVMLKIVALVGT
jgi:hypothetical protein